MGLLLLKSAAHLIQSLALLSFDRTVLHYRLDLTSAPKALLTPPRTRVILYSSMAQAICSEGSSAKSAHPSSLVPQDRGVS